MKTKSRIIQMLVGILTAGMPVLVGAQNDTSVFELAGAEAKYTPGDFKPAPEKMKNWIKTLPDRGFFVYIRYYGPLKAFNDKTWVPNDLELVQ
jgi:hypothetical protein